MAVVLPQFDVSPLGSATASLVDVVTCGAPKLSSSKHTVGAIDAVERVRRLAAIAIVDLMAEIHSSRSFYDHGHANARIMIAHVAELSLAESMRLDQIRRMTAQATDIASVWRKGDLSQDKAALIAKAFVNPRTRERFLVDQQWFLKRARKFNIVRLSKKIANWVELHDQDGPCPSGDPSFARRKAWLAQEHFSKSWRLEADLGSMQGSEFNQIFKAYIKAEFTLDWAEAEKLHGAKTSMSLLARTHEQRCADALCQMAADACNSDKPSAPVKKVHNIIYDSATWEEHLRRLVGAPARILNPDTYNVSDIDGHPIFAAHAFADSLVNTVRRVIQTPAGVTIDMSPDQRLFTGLARLGVILATTECYWPGCHVPTSQCHMDHIRPAACGGQTIQINGLPACPRHNWFKEKGYTVTRHPDGEITITTPTGETIH